MSRHGTPKPHAIQHLGMAFGRQHAMVNQDINALYDLMTGVTPTLKAFEKISPNDDFHHRSAAVGVKDLTLAATVCSPLAYEVSEDDDLYFILPVHGEASALCDNRHYITSPTQGAVLTPGYARKGSMGTASVLQATLKTERLHATAMTMVGPHFHSALTDRLRNPHVMAMRAGPLHFGHLFATICKTIDDCQLQAGTLNALGIDDLFYRSVVTMVFPEAFAKEAGHTRPLAPSPLDRVCDYIDAHLTETIYLTELEAIGQFSTRSLQYAFLRRFGCSPTAWIRQRRLQLAHQRLTQASPTETVTSIALECGFSNTSDFARLYLENYGESPRFALQRALR